MVREDPIKLSEAPARFFADAWARLTSLKGGGAEALGALDNPDPVALVCLRRELLELNRGTPEVRAEATAAEEANALVNRLHEDLRVLGAKGRIIAFGLYLGTGLRQAIPPELWATAKVAFGAGSVVSNGFVYHNVTLELAAASVDVESTAFTMSAWLDQRHAQRGEESKKILQEAAREKFGEAFTVRTFNKAYGDCYKRPRGRPAKRK